MQERVQEDVFIAALFKDFAAPDVLEDADPKILSSHGRLQTPTAP
jgi:hypothetical protein